MSQAAELKRACFKPVTGKGKKIDVHFNPVSLQYTVTNTLQEQGKDKKQYVSKSTAKLTMDLIFDTTDSGHDVRAYSGAIAKFMEPVKSHGSDKNGVPAVVEFEWGAYHFQGMVESYKETIDFFAPSGVPLRASVNLTLSSQDKVFDPAPTSSADAPSQEPVLVPTAPGQTATDVATQGGDPAAGPDLAAANGEESMRFPSGTSMTVDPSVHLRGPVAFATGGIGGGIGIGAGLGGGIGFGGGIGGGIGIGAGLGGGIGAGVGIGGRIGGGIGVSGGFGGGISGGIGAVGGGLGVVGGMAGAGVGLTGGFTSGVSVGGTMSVGSAGFSSAGGIVTGAGLGVGASGGGFGVGAAFAAGGGFGGTALVGGSSSAGVSASSGAFSWLRTSGPARGFTGLDPDRLLPVTTSIALATGPGTSFQVGGQVTFDGPSSLSADVGATASLRSRIRFEER